MLALLLWPRGARALLALRERPPNEDTVGYWSGFLDENGCGMPRIIARGRKPLPDGDELVRLLRAGLALARAGVVASLTRALLGESWRVPEALASATHEVEMEKLWDKIEVLKMSRFWLRLTLAESSLLCRCLRSLGTTRS